MTAGDQPRIATGVTVTPPSNNPPVASFTYSCNQNVCTFDGRGSTDENPTSLTYTWNFGTLGVHDNGSGPLPTRTFTAPSPAGAPFQVTLTVRDEWTVTNTSAAQSVTIVEPTGNSAPVPTFITELHRAHLLGEQPGHGGPEHRVTRIAYSWNWGDGTALSTGASPSAHAYAAAGAYTITLTTTDGWGKLASTTRNVTLTEPAGNQPPSVAFTASCPTYTTCQFNSAGHGRPRG